MIKKIVAFVVKARLPIVIAVLAFAGICGYLSTKVNVNYDFTKYLQEDTDTVQALAVMKEEFGMTGTSEVMVRNITLAEAKGIQGQLQDVENIKTVNFFNTPIYFRDEDGDGVGDAVFKLFFDGDDYSAESESAIMGIEKVLKGRDIAFNGAAEHNMSLKHRLQSQVVLATAVSIFIVVVILILTSKSWMEPLIIGAVLGAAIIINMGTNYFLGEISFVTKSIAAILQIALTIDYSIMLLHQYRDELSYGCEPADAMKKALVNAMSPISSSALTTVTGLAAIMFMSFSLGFDIGLILSKAIVCSMLSVFLLMPSLTVIFAKQIKDLEHRDVIKEPNKKKTGFSKKMDKIKKPVVIIFALLLIGSYFVQSGANFIYLETEKDMVGKKNAVEERFGYSNFVMVLTPKATTDADYLKQEELIAWLKELKNSEGDDIYRDALSTVTTTRRLVDAKDGATLLGMDEGLVGQLFGMYYLEKTGAKQDVEMSLREFVVYLDDLATGKKQPPFDFDVKEVLGGDVSGILLDLLEFIDDGINSDKLYGFLQSGGIKDLGIDLSGLPKEYIDQVFGMYYYHIGKMDEKISLYDIMTYLDGAVESGEGIDIGAFLDEDDKATVSAFAKLLRALNDPTGMPPKDFYRLLADGESALGISLDGIKEGYIEHIYAYYNLPSDYKISLPNLIGYLADVARGDADSAIDLAEVIDGELLDYIVLLDELMKLIPESYTPEELIEALSDGGFDEALGVSLADLPTGYIKQVYGMYYYTKGFIGEDAKISIRDMVKYLADATAENDDGSRKAYSNIDLLPILGDGAKILQAVSFFFDLLERPLSAEDFYGALTGDVVSELLGEDLDLIERGYIDHVYAYYNFKQLTGDYRITTADFIDYICGVLKGDPNYKITIDLLGTDLGGGVDFSEVGAYIEILEKIIDMRGKAYTPRQLEALVKGDLLSGLDDAEELAALLDIAYINQIYGMYYYAKGRMNGDELTATQILEFLDEIVSGERDFPIDVGAILGENADFLKAAVKLTDIMETQYTYGGLYGELLSDEIKNIVDITNIDGEGTGISSDYLRILYAWKQYKKHGMDVGRKNYYDVLNPLFEVARIANVQFDWLEEAAIRGVVWTATAFDLFRTHTPAEAGNYFAGLANDFGADVTPEMMREVVEIAYAWDAFKGIANTKTDNVKDLFQFIANDVAALDGAAHLGILDGMFDESTVSLLNIVAGMPDDLKKSISYTEMAEMIDEYAEKFGMTEEGESLIPAALMKQAYILYWGSRDFGNMDLKGGNKSVEIIELMKYAAAVVTPGDENPYFDGFIYDDILIPVLSGLVEGGTEGAKEMISLAVKAADVVFDIDKNFAKAMTYGELTYKINEYIASVSPDTDPLDAGFIEQAYVAYYYNENPTDALGEVWLTEMSAFIRELLDGDGIDDNPIVADALGENAALVVEVLTLAERIAGDLDTPFEYSRMATELAGYLDALGGDFSVEIDEELIRQAYIMYFSAKDYSGIAPFERSVAVSDLVEYIAGLADKTNGEYYNDFLYGILLDALAGDDAEKIAEIEEIIAKVSGAVSEIFTYLNIPFGYADIAGYLNGYISEFGFIDALEGVSIDENLIRQAFAMYFSEYEPDEAGKPIAFLEVVSYIRDLIDGDGNNDDKIISDFLGEELKDTLVFAERVHSESKEALTYGGAAERIDEYLNRLGAASGAASDVFGAAASDGTDYEELMLQAYILYAGSSGGIPTDIEEVSKLLDYLFKVIDPESKDYNELVGGLVAELLGDSAASISGDFADGVREFIGGVDSKKSYTDLAASVNSIVGAAAGLLGAETDGLGERLFEQIYVFKLSEDAVPTGKVMVADLVDFLYEIIDDKIISGFVDEQTRADMDNYRASLSTADEMFNGDTYSRMVFTFNIPTSGDEAFDFVDSLREEAKRIFGDDVRVAGTTVVLKDIRNNFEMDTFVISLASILSVFLVIALIYKSFMIPMILVLLIQAATWIAFSFSSIFGEPVYFMAYTVVSCIQMGAAIDYGIILSTKYLYNRKFMNKRDAVNCAVKESLKTILTSGSILVIAGLVLYVISSTMVLSSIGMYIFRGVLTSILMTIFVLPAMLLVFDKWIEKTTKNANFYKGMRTIDGGDYILDAEGGFAVSLEKQAREESFRMSGGGRVENAKKPFEANGDRYEITKKYFDGTNDGRYEDIKKPYDANSGGYETTKKYFNGTNDGQYETTKKYFDGTNDGRYEATKKYFDRTNGGWYEDTKNSVDGMNGGRYEPQRPFDEEVSVEIEPDFGYDEIFNPYRKDNK